MAAALLDTDVLHKAARYGLIARLLGSVPLGVDAFCMLGAARFVILKKLTKKPPGRGSAAAIAQFEVETPGIVLLEPTEDEVRYAAALELLAQRLGLQLDIGESQLCVLLTQRAYDYLFTGDKRAIKAIEGLLAEGELRADGKIVCLEQLFLWLVHHGGLDEARAAVCAEPGADTALAACFACNSAETTPENCCQGLKSYIDDLRRAAPSALLPAP